MENVFERTTLHKDIIFREDIQLDGLFNGRKEYIAKISQSSTNAPISNVIFVNTLGGVPVWTRSATGIYELTLAGAFPSGKVDAWVTNDNYQDGANFSIYIDNFIQTNLVTLRSTRDQVNADSVVGDIDRTINVIHIVVYP